MIPEQNCRKNGYYLFKKILDNHAPHLEELKKESLAINLEKGIFNAAVKKFLYGNPKHTFWTTTFRNDFYIPIFLHIYSNLNPSNIVNNTQLLPRFLSNNFSIDYLCQEMSAEEMFPQRYYDYHNEQNEELEKIERHKKQLETTFGIFKCGRCKSNKTTYYEMQTRSAKIGHYSTILKVFASKVINNFATLSNCGKSLRAFITLNRVMTEV